MIGYIKNKLYSLYVCFYAVFLNGEIIGDIIFGRYIFHDVDEERFTELKEIFWETLIIAFKGFWMTLWYPLLKFWIGMHLCFWGIDACFYGMFLILRIMNFVIEFEATIEVNLKLQNNSISF